MTPIVAVTQRVTIDPRHGERRDALDQRWTRFLTACGLVPLLVPNDLDAALSLLAETPVRGLLLTGGNTLAAYGGDAPERDRVEMEALGFARARRMPVLGVCRGMQVLLHAFGVPLAPVTGHAGGAHPLTGGRTVNSFHDFAAVHAGGPLTITARAADGVIEAVAHPTERIRGVMWHPERVETFDDDDVTLVRQLFREAV
jgi:putative glutamine amidotransferase